MSEQPSIDNPLRRKLATRQPPVSTLAACPFCAGAAEIRYRCEHAGQPASHQAVCTECGAASPIIPSEIWAWERNKYLRQDSATLAVQHWNRRAS